jgi:hypothetical protein
MARVTIAPPPTCFAPKSSVQRKAPALVPPPLPASFRRTAAPPGTNRAVQLASSIGLPKPGARTETPEERTVRLKEQRAKRLAEQAAFAEARKKIMDDAKAERKANPGMALARAAASRPVLNPIPTITSATAVAVSPSASKHLGLYRSEDNSARSVLDELKITATTAPSVTKAILGRSDRVITAIPSRLTSGKTDYQVTVPSHAARDFSIVFTKMVNLDRITVFHIGPGAP